MSKQKKQSWQHPDTLITGLSMRLDALAPAESALLFQAGKIQSQAECRTLQCLNPSRKDGALTDKEIEKALIKGFEVSRRWARSWLKDAKAQRSSVVELAVTNLTGAEARLARLQKRVIKTERQVKEYYTSEKAPKKWVHNSLGKQLQLIPYTELQRNARVLRGRLDRQTTKVKKLRSIVNGATEPSICYGSKKLARKRHTLETKEEITIWQLEWEYARYGHLFIEGDKQFNNGNPYIQYNRITNDLKITLPFKDPATGKSVNFNTQPRSTDERLDKLLIGYEGPVTTRLTYNQKKGYWYVHFTIREQIVPEWTSKKNGAIGVDLNPNHLAYSYTNATGNPIIKDTGRLDIIMGYDKQATVKRASQVARELVSLAVEKGCPIVLENLNFGSAKMNLRHLPKKLRIKFSSFAYNTYKTIIAREAARAGVETIFIHPAYTSKLGQANYANPYGVSVDMAAAIVIARRALNLRERTRQCVVDRLELDDSRPVNLLSRKMPLRRQTWDDGRLSRKTWLSADGWPQPLPLDTSLDVIQIASPREPANVPRLKT